MLKYYWKIIFGLLLVEMGCRPGAEFQDQKKPFLPASFALNEDTGRQPLPNWRSYFADSTLVHLIDIALKNNFDLRDALQRMEIFRSTVVQNTGIRLPDLNLQVGAGVRKFGEYTMDGVGNYDTRFSQNLNSKQQLPDPIPDFLLGFQSSWEIDLWGKLKNRKKSAVARFLASGHGKNLIQSSLVAMVANVYYDFLELKSELLIIQENIRLQTRAVEIVNLQKQTGQANQLAVEILEAQLLSSKKMEVQIEQDIIETENQLNFLLGRYPQKIEVQTNFLSLPIPAGFSNGVPSDMLVRRPDIQQAEFELQSKQADLMAARQAFYPSININSGIALQAFNSGLLFETPTSLAYSVLGGLTAPLLNRRLLKAQLLNAKAEQKQAYIEYEKRITQGFIEVYNSLKNKENTDKMFFLKNQEVIILRQSVVTSADLFVSGRAGYLEIVNSQRNALQSQLELAELKKRQFKSRISLYKALGGGWD